jgi:hypothetical protein
MFFKHRTFTALLLFIIIIVFAFLSYNNELIYIEGATNMSDNVPDCNGDKNVPGCYNTVLDYDIYNYDPTSILAMDDDNYILKTQIIPPVCPSCPTQLIDHGHIDIDNSYNSDISNNFDDNGNYINNDNIQNSNNLYASSNDIEQTSISNNENTSTTNNNQKLSTVYNYTYDNNNNKGSNVNNGGSNNILSGGMGNSGNEYYENEIRRLKGEISKLKQSGGGGNYVKEECPPCPACERCPEPAFTCEKVINYRSPNVGNYLPLPVLNDFSTF